MMHCRPSVDEWDGLPHYTAPARFQLPPQCSHSIPTKYIPIVNPFTIGYTRNFSSSNPTQYFMDVARAGYPMGRWDTNRQVYQERSHQRYAKVLFPALGDDLSHETLGKFLDGRLVVAGISRW
jgi:hypothetical protein